MNIFEVLNQGNSRLHEPSVSAMSGYLLDTRRDHGLGDTDPHFAARGKDERSKLSPGSVYSYSITNYVFIYRFYHQPIRRILLKHQVIIDAGIRLHNVMKLLTQRCNFKFAGRDIYNLC